MEYAINETLYYEPVYEPSLDSLAPEFDAQIPEYINPDWDDEVLYNLICDNQDALVSVNGIVMTLSAAMNEHPGPWIPENEPNLIAYALDLLASSVIEPAVPEEEIPAEAENERALEPDRPEAFPVEELAQSTPTENIPDRQKEHTMSRPLETAPVPYESTEPVMVPNVPQPIVEVAPPRKPTSIRVDTAIRDNREVADNTGEETTAPEILHQSTGPQSRAEAAEQLLGPAESVDVEEIPARDEGLPEPRVPVEVPETFDQLCIESDTIMEGVEQDDGRVLTDDILGEEVADDLYVFDDVHEPSVSLSEFADEKPLDLMPDDVPDAATSDQIVAIEPDQLEPISGMVEEVESTLMQLVEFVELIESNIPEDHEDIGIILDRIFDSPVRLERATKQEWEELYVELFEAAGVPYSYELIESLSSLTIKWNLIEEIERLNDVGSDTRIDGDRSARAFVRKLLVAITNIIQTIRHIFSIGTYALGLCVAPRAGYR